MESIYILKLKEGKYYVGITKNISKRIKEHMDGKGCIWTKKYKPNGIEKIIKNITKYDEDKFVKIYMEKYGIDNVRGGSYSNLKLTNLQKSFIKNELRVVDNSCFICGKMGHYAKNCRNNKINMMNLKYECSYCFKIFNTKSDALEHIEKICYPKNYDINKFMIDLK